MAKLVAAIQKAMFEAMIEARLWGSDFASLDMYTEFRFRCWTEDGILYCNLLGVR